MTLIKLQGLGNWPYSVLHVHSLEWIYPRTGTRKKISRYFGLYWLPFPNAFLNTDGVSEEAWLMMAITRLTTWWWRTQMMMWCLQMERPSFAKMAPISTTWNMLYMLKIRWDCYCNWCSASGWEKQKPRCSNHKAANEGGSGRKNLDCTGVVGCACARHGCFVPHTMVDLQKGERYSPGCSIRSSTLKVPLLFYFQTGERGLCYLPGH